MELTIDEFDLLLSIRLRYVNMSKRFVPDIGNFATLMMLIRELHSIHQVERKIVMSRYQQVMEVKQVSAEAHNPSRFFKYLGTLSEFKHFWNDLNKEIFNSNVRADLTAIYANEPRIASIKAGYHAMRTGKENGKEILALLAVQHPVVRITFTDGNLIDLNSFEEDEIQRVQEVYQKKMGKSLSFTM